MPQSPHAVEVKQCAKVATDGPCAVIRAGISADRPVKKIGMAVTDPFDLAALLPKAPSPRFDFGCIGQRDKEYGFPTQASEKLTAGGKPYSMLIGSKRSSGVGPLHIL